MARKNYSDEFRRQAVDVYESGPGATVRGIADDLGVERGTLRHWLDVHGTGKKTAADGTLTTSPLKPGQPAPPSVGARDETPEQQIARLESRVSELRRDGVDVVGFTGFKTATTEELPDYTLDCEEPVTPADPVYAGPGRPPLRDAS